MILQFNFNSFLYNIMPDAWPDNFRGFLSVVIQIIAITLIFTFIKRVIKGNIPAKITSKTVKASQRANTINTLINNFLMYILYFFYFYIVLSLLGFPVETLLAGAGIAGVAIGLGSKDLISDMINGFFIIFENHFVVGDFIEIPSEKITGTVTDVGIRTTTIKAASGDLFYVPNSIITIVNNKARHKRQINIEIPFSVQNNIHHFVSLIETITQEVYTDYIEVMTDEPVIVGFIPDSMQTFKYRITFLVHSGEDYLHTSIFYGKYLEKLQMSGIIIPSPLDKEA